MAKPASAAADYRGASSRDDSGLLTSALSERKWRNHLKMFLRECVATWRSLLLINPRFLWLCVLTLSLGIAASTTTFALLDNFVLKPPPYKDASRLVMLGPATSSYATTMSPQQYGFLLGIRDFESIGAADFSRQETVTAPTGTRLLNILPVSHSFLETLGIRMALGRNFTEKEDQPDTRAAIIGYRLWITDFNTNPGVLSDVIKIEGKPYSVVGVLPQSFQFGETLDLLTPLGLTIPSPDTGNHLTAIARLRFGVTLARASAALDTSMSSHRADPLAAPSHQRFSAIPLQRSLSGPARVIVFLFFTFGLCLLALVGANLSNLLLLRSITIHRLTAIRFALGAVGLRLTGPILSEGVLIGALGLGLGLLASSVALTLIGSHIPPVWMNSGQGSSLTLHAYLLGTLLAFFVPLFSSAVAIFRTKCDDLTTALDSETRIGRSRGSRQFGRILLVCQIWLATTLLVVGASLFAALQHLLRINLGINSDNVVTFAIQPARSACPTGSALRRYVGELLASVEQNGTAAAALNRPIGDSFSIPVRMATERQVQYRLVTPAYFRVLQIPMLSGRSFDAHDIQGAESVAIVNSLYASRYIRGNPINQTIVTALNATGRPGPLRVIGVVGDTRQSGPQSPEAPVIYASLDQVSDNLLTEMREFLPIQFFLRSRLTLYHVRDILRQLVPDQAIIGPYPLYEQIRQLTLDQELDAKVGLIAGLLATLVAALGLYAVISLTLTMRRRDYAVQAALGATPGRIGCAVVGEVVSQLAVGFIFGCVTAYLVSRYVAHALSGFTAPNAQVFCGVGFALAFVAVIICLPAAVRAARINPAAELRAAP